MHARFLLLTLLLASPALAQTGTAPAEAMARDTTSAPVLASLERVLPFIAPSMLKQIPQGFVLVDTALVHLVEDGAVTARTGRLASFRRTGSGEGTRFIRMPGAGSGSQGTAVPAGEVVIGETRKCRTGERFQQIVVRTRELHYSNTRSVEYFLRDTAVPSAYEETSPLGAGTTRILTLSDGIPDASGNPCFRSVTIFFDRSVRSFTVGDQGVWREMITRERAEERKTAHERATAEQRVVDEQRARVLAEKEVEEIRQHRAAWQRRRFALGMVAAIGYGSIPGIAHNSQPGVNDLGPSINPDLELGLVLPFRLVGSLWLTNELAYAYRVVELGA